MSVAATEALMAPDEGDRRSRRRLLLLLLPVILLVLGGCAAAWFLVFAPDADAGEPAIVEGEIVALEPQTTTLGGGSLRHARVAVAIVLAEGVDPTVVAERSELLQDALLRELADMDAEGLRSAAGSDRLRRRLSEEAVTIWEEGQVVRVVLTELLVQ